MGSSTGLSRPPRQGGIDNTSVESGPWILAELTPASDEVSDDPESEYWEEVEANKARG